MTRHAYTLTATLSAVIGATFGLACTDPPESDDEAKSSSGTDTGNSTGDGDGDPAGDGDGDPAGDGDGDGDGDAPCMGPADCQDPAMPLCDLRSGTCVACDALPDPDTACAELDPAAPVCNAGLCVQCTEDLDQACQDTAPICDADTNLCVACTDHAQCPDSACNMADGNCFDPDSIVHVDGDDPCNSGDGTQDSPYCSIQEALDNAALEVLIILHERFNDLPYLEQGNVAIAVAAFAADGEFVRILGTGGNPALTVTPSGSLFVRDLQFSGGDVEGILINGGSTWIERARVVNNAGGGIVVDGGGTLMLENSFVGGDVNDRNAIYVADGAADILYSTLAGGFGSASALLCDDGSSTNVRNSLLVARTDSDELTCPNATLTNNALEMDIAGNTSLGSMMDTGWFPGFAQGDFELSGTHPDAIDTAAIWQTGDPTTDIEGDPRPTTDGTPDFAGADRVP